MFKVQKIRYHLKIVMFFYNSGIVKSHFLEESCILG